MKQSDKTDNEVKYVVQRFLMKDSKVINPLLSIEASYHTYDEALEAYKKNKSSIRKTVIVLRQDLEIPELQYEESVCYNFEDMWEDEPNASKGYIIQDLIGTRKNPVRWADYDKQTHQSLEDAARALRMYKFKSFANRIIQRKSRKDYVEPKLFRIVRRLDAILLDSQKGEEN